MHRQPAHTSHLNWRLFLIATVSLIVLPACGTLVTSEQQTSNEYDAPSLETPLPEETVMYSSVIAKGTFEGLSNHETSGLGSIIESNGKYFILLDENFSLDGAPDPKVGLGKNGYDPTTKVGPLLELSGMSSYEIPEAVQITDYNEIYIWCEKFDVPLGVAKLS